MDLISEDDEEEEESTSVSSPIDETVIDKWLYDFQTGPLKKLLKKGPYTSKIMLKTKLEELYNDIPHEGSEEATLKRSILESKMARIEAEYLKFESKFPKSWQTYKRFKCHNSSGNCLR